MNAEFKDTFLSLVRLGIGNEETLDSECVDWNAMEVFALTQGLSAILIDDIEKIPNDKKPPKETLLQWIGETLQSYEYRYELYERAIVELAGWYNEHGFKMMVLKGYACSSNWPKPEHRPCGDIDIWLFGQQKEADKVMSRERNIKIDKSHHHHTVFEWQNFTVENHYDFVNVHHSKSNASIEQVFKTLGEDDTRYANVSGVKIYLPSPNLHALFLLRHSMIEFAATGITLRQLLDWAFFVEKHTKDIDWDWLQSVLDEYHMRDFYNCINAICVEDLGFESAYFPKTHYNPLDKDRVLNEILEPEIPNVRPQQILKRVVWKTRRWKANEWKHKLCYEESMWSTFWSGVWSHLLKPSSI